MGWIPARSREAETSRRSSATDGLGSDGPFWSLPAGEDGSSKEKAAGAGDRPAGAVQVPGGLDRRRPRHRERGVCRQQLRDGAIEHGFDLVPVLTTDPLDAEA